jgi:hypothetical protein
MRLTPIGPALAVAIATIALAPSAQAVGPGGWDHLGTQISSGNTAAALNGDVLAMNTQLPGQLLAAGKFTHAGGVAGADRVASWNGTSWSAVGPPTSFNGDVHALATANGKLYAGGVFTNAGGDVNADFLAEYSGGTWHSFCTNGTPFGGNVLALQVIGNNLYVGGSFQNGAGLADADYLVRCDLTTGIASEDITDPAHPFSGSVYALTADSGGTLYAAGGFSDLENNTASDNVARFSGGVWSNLGSGAGPCGCAVDDFVRSLASDGTNVYVGADSVDIAGIPQADHVARWNGTSWSAVGANAAGTNGYLPTVAPVDALFTVGSHVYASGNWLDVGGDPTADYLADFDGTSWKPVSSDGAGNGALNAKGESFATFGGVLHVGGNFTKAGGDSLASFLARFVGIPNNVITVGKVKPNKANGTAKLSVAVPGAGVLTVTAKGIKGVTSTPGAAGPVVVKIKPKGKTLKQLKAHGKAKVKVTITYTPTGGTARSVTEKVKLVRHRRS